MIRLITLLFLSSVLVFSSGLDTAIRIQSGAISSNSVSSRVTISGLTNLNAGGITVSNLTTLSGFSVRNDQSDYSVAQLTSGTAVSVSWTNANNFLALAHNATVSWIDYPTGATYTRELRLDVTNTGAFSLAFNTVNGNTIKWRTSDGSAPAAPASTLSRFVFTYDRTNYWGEMDTAPVGITQLTFAATKRVAGRNTTGAGLGEEVTLTQLLDWIGSAAQGDILYRGASSWARLAAGTSGNFLQTQGAGANPIWAASAGGGGSLTTNNVVYPLNYFYTPIGPSNTTAEVTIFTNTIPAGALSTNRAYVVEMTLDVFNNSGSGQVVWFEVYLGGTKVFEDSTGSIASNAAHQVARVYFSLQALGSTSSQLGFFQDSFGKVGTASTGLGELNTDTPVWAGTGGFTASKDSTATIPVDIHVAPNAANASFAVKCIAARDRIE